MIKVTLAQYDTEIHVSDTEKNKVVRFLMPLDLRSPSGAIGLRGLQHLVASIEAGIMFLDGLPSDDQRRRDDDKVEDIRYAEECRAANTSYEVPQ